MYPILFIRFCNKLLLNRPFKNLLLTSMLLTFSTLTIANEDTSIANSEQLGMKQLILAVLKHNPSVEAMQSAWQAAESRIDQLSALDDPMLSYSFAPNTLNAKSRDFGQKLQLSQKLPWPGKLDLRGDSARYEAKASQENIRLLQLKLIEASVIAFADWYYIHEAQRINKINQDLWHEFRAIAELKYSTGRASKQHVLRAEVEQTMLEHKAIVLLRKKRNVLAHLNTLLNRVPDTAIAPPTSLPIAQPLPSVAKLRKAAIEQHPEITALLALKQASDSNVKLAERDYYPDFNLNAGYNSLWDREDKRFTIGLGINIPLGQDKRNAKISEKRARLLQMKWEIQDKQAMLASAVQRAYNNVEESRHVIKLYKNKLMPLAEENLYTSKVDYQSGKGGFLDLVSAEKNLIQTQLSYIEAKANYQRHLAKLTRHVGIPYLLDNSLTIFGMHSSFQNDVMKGESR